MKSFYAPMFINIYNFLITFNVQPKVGIGSLLKFW